VWGPKKFAYYASSLYYPRPGHCYVAASVAQGVVHTAAYDITFRHTGNMRLLDALIRCKLPVGRDAPDADTPDAYYPDPPGHNPLRTKSRRTESPF